MDKVRVGIIGCGGISLRHITDMLAQPDVRIVALVDTSDGSLAKTVEHAPAVADVPQFKDYREMLDKIAVDAVVINTPHTLHYEQAVEALSRGVHTLIEKPMVCKSEHAVALIAEAQERGLVLESAYQRHFQPSFIYIRDQIAAGAIGDIHFVSALQGQNWKNGVAGTWRQIPELSGGGQLNDSGSHLVDIVMWTTGLTARQVSAFIDNRGTPVDINSAVSIEFTNGARGTLSVIGDALVGFYEDIMFFGAGGVLRCSNGVTYQSAGGGKLEEVTDLPAGSNVDKNFIDAIRGRDQVWAPGECSLRVIGLTEAAWKSAETGMPVAVKGA